MQRSLVGLVLVAIALVVFAPIVLGGKTWNDVRYHTEIAPPRIAAADAVLHRELPLWWEGTALGVPLLAEPSHGAAYPPGWIAATPRAVDLLAIAHVLWLALGVAWWARRLAASDLGAVIAGALVMTSGVIASAALRGVLPALAHLPWLAICADAAVTASSPARRVRAALGAGVLFALIGLAGQFGVLVQAVCVIAASRGRGARWVAIATAAGLAIAMLQWLPALIAMHDGAGVAIDRLGAAHAVELVIPGAGSGWFPALHVGAPVLGLAVLARPAWQHIALMAALLIAAFVAERGELHLAGLAVIAAAHAGRGFDRACALVERTRLGRTRVVHKLVLAIVLLAPTAAALPLLVGTADRAIVAEPPAWAHAATTAARVAVLEGKLQARTPLRVFRPIMFASDRVEDLDDAIATLAGASGATWGVGAARSEDPARPTAHDQVWLAAAAAGGALLDRYGVAFAILPASMAQGPHALGVRNRWGLVRVPASPAAAVVREWLFVPDDDSALARMFPPGGNGLASGVIVLRGQGAQNQDEPGPAEPCAIERWAHGAIDLRCTADQPAYAVVSSSALPGWSVTVDGAERSWQSADVMRRAVELPAGAHRIAWRYWPRGLTVGLVLAALGSVGLLALWLVYGRDPHAEDRPPDPARPDEN